MDHTWPVWIVLLIAVPIPAEERPRPKASPADRLAELRKQHEEAEGAFWKAAEDLPDTPEGNKKAAEMRKSFDDKQAKLFKEAVELVKGDPKSETGFAALEWVLTIPRAYYLPGGKEAVELAATHHAANPKIGKVIAWIGYYTPSERADSHDAAITLIRAVADKNPDRIARGQAVMALARQAKTKFAVAEYKKTPDVEPHAVEAERASGGGDQGLRRLPSTAPGERLDTRRRRQAGSL